LDDNHPSAVIIHAQISKNNRFDQDEFDDRFRAHRPDGARQSNWPPEESTRGKVAEFDDRFRAHPPDGARQSNWPPEESTRGKEAEFDDRRRVRGFNDARQFDRSSEETVGDKVAEFDYAYRYVSDLLDKGSASEHSSLLNYLGKLASEQKNFAGHIMRSTEGEVLARLHSIPTNVVPMFAPFKQPYTGDWISAFEQARSEATEKYYNSDNSDNSDRNGDATIYDIIVPICSPGGNTALLKRMIAHMNAAKSLKHPRIRIITYAYSQVASCAFVFHQAGDICIASQCAQLMCHEPMQTQWAGQSQQVTTEADGADQLAGELQELKEVLYQECELNLFKRCHQGRVPKKRDLRELRQKWMKEHKLRLSQFFQSCRPSLSIRDGLPKFDYEHKTIFHYLTEDIAHDSHHKWIEAPWAWLVGIVDLVGIDIHFRNTRATIAVQDTQFRQSLECGIY
jgi:hypothetical protein